MPTQTEIDNLISDIETLAGVIVTDVINLNDTTAAIIEADEQLAAMDAVFMGAVFTERFQINQKLVYTNEDQRKVALIEKQVADQPYQAMKVAKTTLFQTRATQLANLEQNRNLIKTKMLLFEFWGGNPDDLNVGGGGNGGGVVAELPESGQGSFFFAFDGYVADSTAAVSAVNEVRFFRFNLKTSIIIDALAWTANGNAPEKVSFGLYSNDGASLLVDSGIVAADSWSGGNVLSVPQITLNRGFYLFAWTSNGGVSTMKQFNVNSAPIRTVWNLGVPNLGKSQLSANDGALPASVVGFLGLTNITIPAVKFFKS